MLKAVFLDWGVCFYEGFQGWGEKNKRNLEALGFGLARIPFLLEAVLYSKILG